MRMTLMATVLAALALAQPLQGQSVGGRLRDAETDSLVVWALVDLIGEDGAPVGRAISDGQGRFLVAAPRPGTYRLQVERSGFHVAVSDRFDLTSERTLEREYRLAFAPMELPSRLVVGRVIDAQNLQPVELATVELVGHGLRELTDAAGRFVLANLTPGTYPIQVGHLGHATRVDTLTVESDETLMVTVRLTARPIPIDPLVVQVRPALPAFTTPELRGFYRRRSYGSGYFLVEEEIRERATGNLMSDVFRGIPGVRLEPNVTMDQTGQVVEAPGYRIEMARASRGHIPCPVIYFIDGVQTEPGVFGIDAFSPSQIAAIEIYRGPVETPVEFGGGQAGCGVVAIWTGTSVYGIAPRPLSQVYPGARLRGTLLRGELLPFEGVLAARDSDTLIVVQNHRAEPDRIPLSAVTSLQISQGRESRAGKGALFGAAAGTLTTVVVYVFSVYYGERDIEPGGIALGITLGAAGGAAIGALIGSRSVSETWQPVVVDTRPRSNLVFPP